MRKSNLTHVYQIVKRRNHILILYKIGICKCNFRNGLLRFLHNFLCGLLGRFRKRLTFFGRSFKKNFNGLPKCQINVWNFGKRATTLYEKYSQSQVDFRIYIQAFYSFISSKIIFAHFLSRFFQ